MKNLLIFLDNPLIFVILGVLFLSGMYMSVFILPKQRTLFHKSVLWIGIICGLTMFWLEISLLLDNKLSWYIILLPLCFFGTGVILYFRKVLFR